MKLHRPLVTGVVDLLFSIFAEGRQADHAVEKGLLAHPRWGSRDRRFVAQSVYHCVRWWRRLWNMAGLADAECLQPENVSRERCWQVWAVSWMEADHERPNFPECASVAYHEPDRGWSPAVLESMPDWLWTLGQEAYGTTWPTIAAGLNAPASVYLRTNSLRLHPLELQAALQKQNIATAPVLHLDVPMALRLSARASLTGTVEFNDGLFEIQDAGSQTIAPLLLATHGMTVIDVCAGGGGKSLHLACLMENRGKILALDVRDHALAQLERRAKRAKTTIISTRTITSEEPLPDLDHKADAVLLDVPCSGLGVLRRHPHTKWKLIAATLDALVIQQRDILQRRSTLVRPGGSLVYATCSILPAENETQVQSFLANNAGWTLEREYHLTPATGDHDGFYAARLRRS